MHKIGASEQVAAVPGQSPRDRQRRLHEEEREPIKRPRRMIIMTINVIIDNKTRVRPNNKDHMEILKQAGLSLGAEAIRPICLVALDYNTTHCI